MCFKYVFQLGLLVFSITIQHWPHVHRRQSLTDYASCCTVVRCIKAPCFHWCCVFAERCYAERGCVTVCRMSVCPWRSSMFFTQVGILRK